MLNLKLALLLADVLIDVEDPTNKPGNSTSVKHNQIPSNTMCEHIKQSNLNEMLDKITRTPQCFNR